MWPIAAQVADAIHLSRRTLAKIKQNLMWAFGYNIISIPLAAGALLPSLGVCLTPSVSGALMGMSSVMVVGNSLLLQLEMRRAFDEAAARRSREAAALPRTSPLDASRTATDSNRSSVTQGSFWALASLNSPAIHPSQGAS